MNAHLLGGAACLLATAACVPLEQAYEQPRTVPRSQLATVSVDARATVLDVDGIPRPSERTPEFSIVAGCRALAVKYEESYFIWGEKKALRKGLGAGLAAAIAESEVHDYETTAPIHFFIPARAGYRYWITATFTGEEFIPRVVETAPNGDTVNRFLPNSRCP